MGKHSAEKARKALAYVRTHKAQIAALSVIGVGLVSRYVPGFPSEDVLRVVGLFLGAA